MEMFRPCRLSPATCSRVRQANYPMFHDWWLAVSFAFRQAAGLQQRHRVTFDGTHWLVEDAR